MPLGNLAVTAINHCALISFLHSYRKLIFSRRFWRKCTTLTVARSFSSVQRDRSTFLFICSTSSTWTTDVQNILETPEPRPKQKHRRPEPRKHRIPPLVCFTRIFSSLCYFFEVFWIPPKGLPFVCFDILQHNGCQKNPKCPLLHFSAFFSASHFNFFWKFLKSPKGPPLIFFSYFATNWSFTRHKGSLLLQFWALDIAPTLAVPGLFLCKLPLLFYLLYVFS